MQEKVGRSVKHIELYTMKTLNLVAMVLVVVGGLNWGLVGLLNFDLVATVFGVASTLTRLVYVLVGVSAVLVLPKLGKGA